MGDLTDHYSTVELTCRDWCGYGSKKEHYGTAWLDFLEIRRTILDRPSKPTSGKRCEARNTAEGGVEDSAHERDALDEQTIGGQARWEAVLATVLAAAVQDGLLMMASARRVYDGLRYARVGVGIAKTFHHVDRDRVKPRPAVWKY